MITEMLKYCVCVNTFKYVFDRTNAFEYTVQKFTFNFCFGSLKNWTLNDRAGLARVNSF